MKLSVLAMVALMGMLGVALGYGYGYSYTPYYGAGAGQGNDSWLCK